jgi:uncharacterized membrane protein YbhN (UPF0104 family)
VDDHLSRLGQGVRRAGLWLEEKPAAIIIAAAGATVGVVFVLGSSAGWPRVTQLAEADHAWWWLAVCLAGELIAYAGYMLTVRDMARLDESAEMSLSVSLQTVIAGFGVFAATRASGGFAVDYWAFQRAGATRREAAARAVGLGLLEYLALSIAALLAAAALYFGIDGHVSDSRTLPSLVIVPFLVLAVYLTSPKRAPRLSRLQGGFVRRWLAGRLAGATTVRKLVTSPREHGLGVLGILAYWAGDILCLWSALQLVDADLPVAALVLAYAGGYVLTRRALPAGGAGVVELALTFALVWMGLPFARTLVAVVVYRLFNFWLPILPALLLMPAIKQLRERFQRVESIV